MRLDPGTRLGPYEIVSAIGAGGMGEVYRARDTRLKRDVALKILPESFATDPERLARFQREAEVLASINHPNIAAIYGFEESNGTRALVMEFVEGETLTDRIARGPIPINEALPLAKQIAEALEGAHEQGIIHRDLKPANIMVRPDGTVKVLDFGLAKLTESSAASPTSAGSLSMSPTMTSPALVSGVGVLLGTAAYMSPEQAKGRSADRRSDVWAFGCVLYEMLSGKRAFLGADVSETLVAILRDEPDWSALPAEIPLGARHVLRLCVQRNPKQRVQAIGDVRLALDGAFDTPSLQAARGQDVATWHRTAALVAGFVVIASGAVAVTWFLVRPATPMTLRATLTAEGAAALAVNGNSRDLVVTPDGTRVVYRGNGQILVRALDRLEANKLVDAANPQSLFVSPDGQWVGFFDSAGLKKVAITGGPAVTLATVPVAGGRGATWGEDDTIMFATAVPENGLQRVSAAGGTPVTVAKPNTDRGEIVYLSPEFLPGGQAMLFTIVPRNVEESQIAVFDLRNGTQKVLIRGGSYAHYVPSGHLVYSVSGTLRAIAFDPERLEVRGTAVPVVSAVFSGRLGTLDFDVSANGTLVYLSGGTAVQTARTMAWVDRQGREIPIRLPPRSYLYPRWSPDGTRVAISINDQQTDIWMWDVARETLTRTTFDPGVDQYPVWTPDGRSLFFGSGGILDSNVFRQAADATGSRQQITKGPNNFVPYSVSPDGRRVVLREGVTTYDLTVMMIGEGDRTEPLLRTPFSELNAEISPNGQWLAYESNESGQREIYVRPFPNVAAGRWQVSTDGGTRPLWARSGQELFYLAISGEDTTLMRVPVGRTTEWSAGTPSKLFSGRFFFETQGPGEGRTYDVSPDGNRFLMIQDSRTDTATLPRSLNLVEHFDEELKRLVPTK